ncbi:MAG TPA: class I SAM-dependent methyltransferase [Rhizomicrobium sp.]|jgi:SAM-dependent methyltransferase|nr:class I SAM-dependent methyltransferase [Rhizomicrobium sp.]
MRAQFGYRTPDDWYEAYLLECVSSDTSWLDVGCGRFLFPSNGRTALLLASRCKLLVGLDPGNNIDDNPYVHERVKAQIEDYRDSRRFDLITLRMVAEHITEPENTLNALARLAKPGGRVVIYTVSKWSPASLAAAATPMAIHHAAKRFLWKTETRDTFPTAYRMNTRGALHTLFARAGFAEQSFEYIDDCRSLQRWRAGALMELSAWRLLRAIGLPYPERCILASYVRNGSGAS